MKKNYKNTTTPSNQIKFFKTMQISSGGLAYRELRFHINVEESIDVFYTKQMAIKKNYTNCEMRPIYTTFCKLFNSGKSCWSMSTYVYARE